MKAPFDETWYLTAYKNDIYDRLKVLEHERFPYRSRSPQLEYRRELIKWLKEQAEEIQFCRVTLHLAVFLLDFFMDSYSIIPEKLTLIAFLCLILAGKFEEHDSKIPRISEINSALQLNYTKAQILNLEKTILKYFNWKLTGPTSVHFAQYYLNFAICPQDICKNCCNFRYVYSVMSCNVFDYLDNVLEDDLLVSYSPSFVAASCILAVRMVLELKPNWPKGLEEVTTYTISDLKNCSSRIIEFKQKNLKLLKRKFDQSPDEGYETEKTIMLSSKSKKDK